MKEKRIRKIKGNDRIWFDDSDTKLNFEVFGYRDFSYTLHILVTDKRTTQQSLMVLNENEIIQLKNYFENIVNKRS